MSKKQVDEVDYIKVSLSNAVSNVEEVNDLMHDLVGMVGISRVVPVFKREEFVTPSEKGLSINNPFSREELDKLRASAGSLDLISHILTGRTIESVETLPEGFSDKSFKIVFTDGTNVEIDAEQHGQTTEVLVRTKLHITTTNVVECEL